MAGHPFQDSGPVRYAPREQPRADRSEAESELLGISGVEGVGEGQDAIGDPAWIAYVRERSTAARLPQRVAGRAVVPEVSGEIDILPA